MKNTTTAFVRVIKTPKCAILSVSKCSDLIRNSAAWLDIIRQSSITLKHYSTVQAPCSQRQHHNRAGCIHPPGMAAWQSSVSSDGQQCWPDVRGDHLVNLSPCHIPPTRQLSHLCILKLGSSYPIPRRPPRASQRQQMALRPTRTARA